MSTTLVALDKVTKQYATHTAVDGLSLTVAGGEIYALLGPNGAGKTTTINMLLGFIAPDRGTLQVAGRNVADDPAAARANIAYIPEQVQLYPQLSGIENLDYFSRLAGHRLSVADLGGMLKRVGLSPEAAIRRAGSYSKGMRQKVGIAIALAKRARVLLLDEPTSGLDPSASAEFVALLREVALEGVAVLMATHDLSGSPDAHPGAGTVPGRLGLRRKAVHRHPIDVGGEVPHLVRIHTRRFIPCGVCRADEQPLP